MRVLLSGGGTAGHINPALTIANTIKEHQPESEFLFVGTKKGMESTLVPKSGYNIKFIDVNGIKRAITIKNMVSVLKACVACVRCRGIIKDFNPDIVIGTGGYVSGPLLKTASSMGIPTLIHEQNVFAGMTSKMLSKSVDTVCISFEKSRAKFTGAKNVVLTGNPLRTELFKTTKEEARKSLGVDNRPFIVSFGGSLGAKRINDCMIDFIKQVPKGKYNILFATGEREYETVSKQLKGIEKEGISVVKYIYNMDEAMNGADLLVCRAGAITVSELNALGKPSVLIPSPNVTDNHQYFNAKALADNGCAMLIEEKDLSNELFNKLVMELLDDSNKLKTMAENSAKLGIKNSAEIIYEEVNKLLK